MANGVNGNIGGTATSKMSKENNSAFIGLLHVIRTYWTISYILTQKRLLDLVMESQMK